ncbi:hypothetical protein MPTK1_2g02570 [Marchantia polymorpha subsp. ruderalis]|uniref:procollagen-proline 3-dioxygenase n=1 Tax=Marchantia polymorpha TaxID=3197 RepID=A0A2R6WM10_MARPO|nr:hypothetical protein MARPO_0075s0019 [Marchantia polymorpha]BBN00842.1 hypothetical protein Mp_2g02570 [Marchantia polymorpha subsp. ruderalis]|eukprot:PTQ34894.1 hypothetical protein MARPO_0075s0019 [Marchantia polymorpha]
MDDFAGARRLVLPQLLSPAECKELEFIHKSCGVVGYRPWVLSTTLCHLVATNCANLILPILPIREKVKEIVEEHFGREYELFTEFTGLISWTKGAKIGWHSDDNRPYLKQRHFSAVCYLNNYEEDFKGGLFHFEEGDPQTVVPSAGTVVIYTADEKNMHCVDEITDGERCTLALWFTLNKAHDEDEKLIQQLSALSSNFCGVMSDQILEQGGLTLGLPVSASSIMYNLNGSVQQDERSDEKSEVAEERPVDDLRLGRMARLGFTCSFSSNYSGDEQDRPVGILYRHEEVPCTFSNMMHALQVIQFHHFRRSIMKLKSSADAEETLAFSKIHDGTNRESLGKENSPLENTHGGTQARRTSEAHLDADIDVRSKRRLAMKTGREMQCVETEIFEVRDFIESWKEWKAYSSNLWDQVCNFLPTWKATRLLVNHT